MQSIPSERGYYPESEEPPLPTEQDEVPPLRSSPSHQRNALSIPHVAPAPSSPASDSGIRRTELQAPSRMISGPASAPLAPTTSPRPRLHSKYHVPGESLSRARSGASSAVTSPNPNLQSPEVPPPHFGANSAPQTPHSVPQNKPSRSFLSQVPRSPSRPSSAASAASRAGNFVVGKMSTLKRSRLRESSKYQKLDEGHDGEIPMDAMREGPMTDGSPQGDVVPIAIDISTFEGPASMRTKTIKRSTKRKSSREDHPDDADILESKGHLTGGLGGGMDDVVETQITLPTNYQPAAKRSIAKRSGSRWMRRQSSTPHPMTQAGQEAAERSGQVIAIDGGLGIDLSNVEGHPGAPVTATNIDLIVDEAAKQSYYFPPDLEMPNWRPLPMQPWYLLLLISIAVVFAAVSEYLVQKGKNPPYLIQFQNADEVPLGIWFVWKYLGEMLLVTYGVMHQATDFEVRRLEPYYQMSQPSGSLAEASLNMDYLTFWSYLIPFKALKHKQWAVVCSSVSTILASAIVPVLFSAAVNLEPNRDERFSDTLKYVQMDPVWTRLLEVTLYIIAVTASLLLYHQRRKSGLAGDLKGIAGIATMATKSHILNDFRGLDRASHQTIHKQLANRRYILHKGSLWQGEYLTKNGVDEQELPKPKNPHPVALHLPVGLVILSSFLLFAALLPVFEFNSKANVVTDKAPWFLPLLATLLKLVWTNLETGVRMIEPFYHLSCRHASARTLLLDYTGTIPGVMPIKASLNGHFVLAAVGVASLLMEVLTVCVSSFNVDGRTLLGSKISEPNGSGETARSYTTTFVLAEIIPAILIVVGILVYLRRRHPFLPRQPGTIASTLAFVHQSRMLYDFIADDDTDDEDSNASPSKSFSRRSATFRKPLAKAKTFASFMSSGRFSRHKDKEMQVAEKTVQSLELSGKTFGLGWYHGRDGKDHVGVDQEELLADYKHGVDWSMGHLGGSAPGDWETL